MNPAKLWIAKDESQILGEHVVCLFPSEPVLRNGYWWRETKQGAATCRQCWPIAEGMGPKLEPGQKFQVSLHLHANPEDEDDDFSLVMGGGVCSFCNGVGQISSGIDFESHTVDVLVREPCPKCNGTGKQR